MLSFSTKTQIIGISSLKSVLLLILGAVFLSGCTQQNLKISKLSCSYKKGAKANICQPASPMTKAQIVPTKKWQTHVATSQPAQPPLAIGRKAHASPKIVTPKTTARRAAPLRPLFATTVSREPRTTISAPLAAQNYRDLASIIRHTLRDNPDIGIALAPERGERASIDIARAGYHPTVDIRAAFGPENYDTDDQRNTAIPRQEFGVDLHQTLYDFGRTKGKVDRRKALYNSAGYRRIDKMNTVAMEVAQAFLSTKEAAEHIKVARQNITSHKDILRLVSASEKAGNATIADVKRVTTRLEKAKTNLIDLRSRKQKAREEFVRLTGLRPDALIAPPTLHAPLPPKNVSSAQYPDNPALLSVRADIDSLRAQARTAKANLEPSIDLDVSGNVKRNVSGETGMTSGLKGMVSFNYKLLDGDARLNTTRQIYIRINETKHLYRKKRRAYIQALDSAIRTVRANLEKSSLLTTRLRDSKNVLRLYKAQFKDGSKTVFEMLDAQMDLFTTSSEKIANQYGKLRSVYEIYALRGDLVGRLLR